MTKSFDAVFKQMKDNTKPMLDSMGCPELLGDIIDDIETNRRHFKIFFEAGQQSKQAEIDQLQRKLDTEKSLRSMSEHLNNTKQSEVDELQKRVKKLELINFDSELHFDAAKEHIDHLQKRIDSAIDHIEDYYGVVGLSVVVDILKGEQTK